MVFNKLAEIESGAAPDATVVNQNIQRVLLRRAVGEGFAIGENSRLLDVSEQFQIAIGRGQGIRGGQPFDDLRFGFGVEHFIQL